MSNPVIVVVGAGPGVGAAVARRFGRQGYEPALISRSQAELDKLGAQLQSEGLTVGWTALDLSDFDALPPPSSVSAAIRVRSPTCISTRA